MQPVVVITGVGGGVGLATAATFHEAGWYVVGIDLKQVQDVISIDQFFHGDVADPEKISRFGAQIIELGRVDALVNNAAVQVNRSLIETSVVEWDLVMNVNVRAAYLMTQMVFPLMSERGGAIVNVSSVHAVATSRGIAAYATSKGALVALTRAAALELASDRIRVNAVLPGAVDTPMLHDGLNRRPEDGGVERGLYLLGQKTPLGRVAQPREVAQAILFLADSARSSFMTGQTLVVDGGAMARLSTE